MTAELIPEPKLEEFGIRPYSEDPEDWEATLPRPGPNGITLGGAIMPGARRCEKMIRYGEAHARSTALNALISFAERMYKISERV